MGHSRGDLAGQWLARVSMNETGTWEVDVRPFQRAGEGVRVSSPPRKLIMAPAWSRHVLVQNWRALLQVELNCHWTHIKAS
jgi:hypothetical protein